MRRDPYSNTIPYQARKAVEDINKKIGEEEKKPAPDAHRLNKMKEERYMPGLFADVMGYYDRFRSPW